MISQTGDKEFHRVRQAVLLGLFSGTGVGLGYLLAGIPGVEFMTLNAVLAGAALGPLTAMGVGALSAALYSLASPFGPPVPLILAAQVLGMGAAGLFGGLAAPAVRRLPWTPAVAVSAVLGIVLALLTDLLTNLAVVVAYDMPLVATLAGGASVTLLHLGTCAVGFGALLPTLAQRLARLRSPGPRVIRILAPLLLAAWATTASAQAVADSVRTTEPVDTPAPGAPQRGLGWKRPLWEPFAGWLRTDLDRNTPWLPVTDGGLGAAAVYFGEPGTAVVPRFTRDGVPLGLGNRFLDDPEAIARAGRQVRTTGFGLDGRGGLGGGVELAPADPVPDRDLVDTRWFKGAHESYLRDVHMLTAAAPWRLGFDFEERLDNEGYDFRTPGEYRYSEFDEANQTDFWGHSKVRSGRGVLTRDLGEAGTLAMSLENVRKLKKGLPVYDVDHQDMWITRTVVDWRTRTAGRPTRLTLRWLDTDVDWDRQTSSARKQEGADNGATAAWGDREEALAVTADWGRWTLVDSGTDASWAVADTGAVRLQGEYASLGGARTWRTRGLRLDGDLNGWWDEHGGWLAGGAAQVAENRILPRWSLRLERGGRAPRSDELATAWRVTVPDGRHTVVLPEGDLDREHEWRLAGSVSSRLAGFDLALSGALRRLRDGIGWLATSDADDVGRLENGLELDSATVRAAVAREGRFLGWMRLRAEGTWRTWERRGDLAVALPPSLDWRLSALWENHFFREDGILQLAWYVTHRGEMTDPWFLTADYELPAYTRVDMIAGFRLVGTNLSVEMLNLTGEEARLSAGSVLHGSEMRWRLHWVFHY